MAEITETLKLIECIKGNLLGLFSIDYHVIKMEIQDLDTEEKKQLLIEIGQAVIEILMALKMSKSSGAIFSTVLKKIV